MPVQILGIREFFDKKEARYKKAETFFNKRWRAETVGKLFENIESVMAQIPEDEHYNLYYTAAECFEKRGRRLERQTIIPFDIDGIDNGQEEQVAQVVCETLGVNPDDCAIVFSGNGVQIIVGLAEEIDSEEYFDENRIYYKGCCQVVNDALKKNSLSGSADSTVFSAGRLLRLPMTKNIKADKGEKNATLYKRHIRKYEFDLKTASGIPVVQQDEQVSEKLLDRIPPDTDAVQEGCLFLKWAYKNQTEVSEPQWYAALSILGRLEDGYKLSHKYSQHHEGYSEHETDRKLEQAMTASGPRTCSNIDTLWHGCRECPHWGKCKSPITIKSKEYIKTKNTGFHNITPEGKVGKPNYDDLMKWYSSKTPFVSLEESGMVYHFDATHWEPVTKVQLHNFAERNFSPKPTHSMCKEFEAKLRRNNPTPRTFFNTMGKINFINGTLHIDDLEFREHDRGDGFKYCLPFSYDPEAECPTFDKFIQEVTCGDRDLEAVLLEFMGYTIAGIDPAIGQKGLVLVGSGANGKSVFIDLLKYLTGEDNYCTLSMGNELNRMENRFRLDGKLFNVSEETPDKGLVDSSLFKELVTGGEMEVRRLYCDPYTIKNTAKIIMACNDLPLNRDSSYGMQRRMLIAPFQQTFTEENRDIHIRKKLYDEAAGIYNRCIRAVKRFLRNERFTNAKIIEDSVKEYIDESNLVMVWVEDNLERDSQSFVSSPELVRQCKLHMENESQYAYKVDGRTIGRAVRKLFSDIAIGRRRVDGSKVRVYEGVRLITDDDDY